MYNLFGSFQNEKKQVWNMDGYNNTINTLNIENILDKSEESFEIIKRTYEYVMEFNNKIFTDYFQGNEYIIKSKKSKNLYNLLLK